MHRPLPTDTDEEDELEVDIVQPRTPSQYRGYCIVKARCRLCQIAVQDGDLLVAYLGNGLTSPWFTFVNDGDCHDDGSKIALHMTLADQPFRNYHVSNSQKLPAICFHLDCHQTHGSWTHEKGPFLAATRYVSRPSLSEERRRLEYNRLKLAKSLQASLRENGQPRPLPELPLEICLNIASFLDRPFATMASSFVWTQIPDTTVNLALPLYASYVKMDGRHYVRKLCNELDQVTGRQANEPQRLVVPPNQGGTDESNYGDILIAVDHLGVRQVFFVPPGQRSNWQRKHPDVPGAWWMHIPRPTGDAYWTSRSDGLKVRKLKPYRGSSGPRMPSVYWKDPVLQIPSMIKLPSKQTWSIENGPPSIVHMRHCDLNLPDTLGLCVAIRRFNHRISRMPACILEGIVSHRKRSGNGSPDDLDVAFMDNLSLSNPYYWIYMPMNRGERVSEVWVRYKPPRMRPEFDDLITLGKGEIFQGVVVSQLVLFITGYPSPFHVICYQFTAVASARPSLFWKLTTKPQFFTNHGRSCVFGTFADDKNVMWRRIAYMHPNLPCRIYFEQRSLKRHNGYFKKMFESPALVSDQLIFAIGGEIDGMGHAMLAEDDSNPPPMPSHRSIGPPRDGSLLDSFLSQWLYTSCSLENIVELQLCIDRRTAASPVPVVMGMVLCYADGGRGCVGQFRPDWVQRPTLRVSSVDELHFYQKRVPGNRLGRLSSITNVPPSQAHASEGEHLITLPQEGILEWWFKKSKNFLVHDHSIFETETGPSAPHGATAFSLAILEDQSTPHLIPARSYHLKDNVEDTCLEADIVAVHGLNGDARKTWTDPESGSFWLEDFLPERAKTARIMTFGYDSKVAFSKSKGGASRRPLIFVAHSLGGIVVKKALIMAYMEHVNYGDIVDSTIGIVFMGTPHRGSDLASWGLILTSLINSASLGTGINKELLKTLKVDSEMLAGISSQFVHRATPLKIRTFTEQQVQRPLNTLVVPPSSAIIGLPNEIVLPLNANHRSMCRFGSSDSENYRIVEETLMEILASCKKAERQYYHQWACFCRYCSLQSNSSKYSISWGRKLTPETYGEGEFSHDLCLPGDTLVENLGKELLKKIPDLKEYRDFIAHGGNREPIEYNWVDKFTSRVEVTNGRPCGNPKKGFKINIDQPIASFFSRAFPRPLQAVRKAVSPNANSLGDSNPTVSSDAIEVGRDIDEPDLAISFMRTARLPWCDAEYQLPPATGSFPLFDVQKFADRMPGTMATQGGIFMPMYRKFRIMLIKSLETIALFLLVFDEEMEALWINFTRLGQKTSTKFAVRPFVGGVNTISGQALHCATMDTILPKKKVLAKNQDYLVSPDQKRLDGISIEPGVVRQFVATEMVSASRKDYLAATNTESEDGSQDKDTPAGASVEWQVTGNDEFGGLQLQIIPTHDVQSMHAGSEENNLYLRGEGLRRYDVLKTPREQGLVAGDVIHIKDLTSLLPRRRKTLSDLVDEFPADEPRNIQGRQGWPAGRDGMMAEIEVARAQTILQTIDVKEQGNRGNTLRLQPLGQFDINESFQEVEAVIKSKMGYENRDGLVFCVWQGANRNSGIVRVQTWEDVRSSTPRTESEIEQTSAREIWDMITVPIGSMPESDYIVEVAMAPWHTGEYTKAMKPSDFCMILNSESTIGHLRSELQQYLGSQIAGTAFKVAGAFWVASDNLEDDVQLKTAEPKADGFINICNGPYTLGRIVFLAGPGIDSSKACKMPRPYRDSYPILREARQMGLGQSLPNQLERQEHSVPRNCPQDIFWGKSPVSSQPYQYKPQDASCSYSSPQFTTDRHHASSLSDRNPNRHGNEIRVQHEGNIYNIAVPLYPWEQNIRFIKLRLFVLTGIQPRNQVLQVRGRSLADIYPVRHLMGDQVKLTTQPPTRPTALGIGAGGKIKQHIEPDYENPRIWDVCSSEILNVQLLDAHTFKMVTGQDPPPTPLSPEKYAEWGLAFEKAWRDELKGPGVSGRTEDGTWGGLSSFEGPMEVAARNAGVQIPAAGELDGGESSGSGPGLGAEHGGFFETAADFPVLLENVDDTVSQFKSAMEADLEKDWSD
ncbi:hypothetical protein PspLS_05891 [Pyricularia sp. CBS 133598]|nr:hypothetical protein PspLS_05891 [Pyricularia sp. CBS 133598]